MTPEEQQKQTDTIQKALDDAKALRDGLEQIENGCTRVIDALEPKIKESPDTKRAEYLKAHARCVWGIREDIRYLLKGKASA